VPSNAEICQAKAAEFYRLASEVADPFAKETYFRLADAWADLSAHFKTLTAVDERSCDDQSSGARFDGPDIQPDCNTANPPKMPPGSIGDGDSSRD
jgi:hypothetical protein